MDRWREARRSAPTGWTKTYTSVAPASNSARSCTSTAVSSPTIAASPAPPRPTHLHDPLVVRSVGVHRGAGRDLRPGLGDVVVHGQREPRHDAGRRATRRSRSRGDPRGDVLLDRRGGRHPEDRPVGVLAGDAEQPGRQGGEEHRDRVRGRDGPFLRPHRPVLAFELEVLAPQQGREDPHVLLGVAARVLVGHPVDAAHVRLVRRPHPEREAGTAHRRGHRRGPLGLQERVAGVGLQHRGAELDASTSPGRRGPSPPAGRPARRWRTRARRTRRPRPAAPARRSCPASPRRRTARSASGQRLGFLEQLDDRRRAEREAGDRDAERGERVGDGVHDRRRRADGAALADALVATRARGRASRCGRAR